MFELPTIACENDGAGDDCAVPSADVNHACPSNMEFHLLLAEAASLFVIQLVEGNHTDDMAIWRSRTPCHGCAWRRVTRAWHLLADAGNLGSG
jgi:hypothetical protein